jgi:HupE / UreJ protein
LRLSGKVSGRETLHSRPPSLLLAALWVALWISPARAHEFKLEAVISAFVTVEPGQAHFVVRAPLYIFKSAKFPIKNAEIDVPQSTDAIARATAALQQDVVLFADGRPLRSSSATGRVSLPSDRSFDSYEDALRHISEPVAPDTHVYVDQGFVDAYITYPLQAPDSEISIRTTAAPELGDSLKLVVRYRPLDGAGRALIMTAGSGTVALNPTWWHATSGFVGLGMAHILTGIDHLLFLLCLIIPLKGWRPLLAIVTTFTVAHSFTLIGSAFHLAPAGAWFPPLVETTIAASIVYMALENIMGIEFGRRVLVTGLFGLVHGFGFSYGLQENLQFAGTHLLASLFAFNIGIEAGQLLVLAMMLPTLMVIRRYVLPGRTGMIILSAIVAQTGWQWLLERGSALRNVPWPQVSFGGLAMLAFWITGILLAAGGVRALSKRLRLRFDVATQSPGAQLQVPRNS